MLVKIDQIVLDKKLQPREYISDSVVDEYHEAIENGSVFPPVTLFDVEGTLYLANGWHRYSAYLKAGISKIDAEIIDGTFEEAMIYTFGVNHDNGLRRTNMDKRKIVTTALQMFPEWSDSKIAETCKVSHGTVSNYRNLSALSKAPLSNLESDDASTDQQRDFRIGKDGRKTLVQNIGKPRTVAEEVQQKLEEEPEDLVRETFEYVTGLLDPDDFMLFLGMCQRWAKKNMRA